MIVSSICAGAKGNNFTQSTEKDRQLIRAKLRFYALITYINSQNRETDRVGSRRDSVKNFWQVRDSDDPMRSIDYNAVMPQFRANDFEQFSRS